MLLRRTRVPRFSAGLSVLLLGTLSLASSASAYSVRVNQWDYFHQETPLTYTPGRGTPAVAETTIRHQVYFTDLEAGTAGWTTVNHRAGMPTGWNIVSGTHACTGTPGGAGMSAFRRVTVTGTAGPRA